jgi:hypothetical protein
MSPDPDDDLLSDQELSRRTMPRIALPGYERRLAANLASTDGTKRLPSFDRGPRNVDGPRQSHRFAVDPSAPGTTIRMIVVRGLHHFSMTRSPSDPAAILTHAIFDLVHR